MSKHAAEKLKFKQTPIPMGILQVKNKINEKIFIVSSPNLPGKINSIKFQLEMGSNMNKALQEDWNTYGEKNFSFDILDLLTNKDLLHNNSDDLKALEEMWLEQLQPFDDKGYNKRKK